MRKVGKNGIRMHNRKKPYRANPSKKVQKSAKKCIHIGNLAPINLLEQKNLFFQQNCEINPVFQYQDQVSIDSYRSRFFPETSLFNSARQILEMCLSDYSTLTQYYERDGGSLLNEQQTTELFDQYTTQLGIHNQVDIKFSEDTVPPTSTLYLPRERKWQLIIQLPLLHRENRFRGVLHHEIGTHVIRSINEQKQVWFKSRDKHSLQPYIQTEEGIAAVNTQIDAAADFNRKPYLIQAALHYYCSALADTMSFVELYHHLELYVDSPMKRWQQCVRVKRGLIDTALSGGCYKDQVYLLGASQFLQRRRDLNFQQLYAGKLCFEDIDRQDIQQIMRTDDILLPCFMQDKETYISLLDRIAEVNMLYQQKMDNKPFPQIKRSVSTQRQVKTSNFDGIVGSTKRNQELEQVIMSKNKEIQRLEGINKQLILGQQKRDEIIAAALDENRKLKENIRWYQRLLAQTKKQIKQQDSPSPTKTKTNNFKPERTQYKLERKTERVNTYNVLQSPSFVNGQNDQNKAAKDFLLDDLLQNPDYFVDKFQGLDEQEQRDLLNHLKEQKTNFHSILSLSIRLKKLITTFHKISVSLVLGEAIERLVSETCETLICDRASVFLLDELNGELWTKAAKGTARTIRIPMDKGIVGYVATTGNPVIIEDAYKDSRFNKAVDIQTNYRTKTILAIPIKDPSGNLIGVMQAINKLNGVFTPDDLVLFELLSSHAGILLRNSMQNETSMLIQHKLRYTLESILTINSLTELEQIISISQVKAKEIMSTDMALIYVKQNDSIVRITDQGKEEFQLTSGLVGTCFREGTVLNIPDAYNDPRFNGKVDIDTSMPVLCIPIKDNEGNSIAVVQVVNDKGVFGRAATNKAKLNQVDTEVLRYFECTLQHALLRVINK